MPLAEACKALLAKQGINPASTIEYDVNGEVHTLTLAQIIESYMQASPEAQRTFTQALKLSLGKGPAGVQSYFEKMGQLLLMTSMGEGTGL